MITHFAQRRRLAPLLLALACARPDPAQLEPVRYTLGVSSSEAQTAVVEASFPTEGRPTIELMMPVWSPGYYRVEGYADRVTVVSARGDAGGDLAVERTADNRWSVTTDGAQRVVISYELSCRQSSVTTNWVSPELGVFNGPATFITLADGLDRPHEVLVELPPEWQAVATGLPELEDGLPHHFRADDYDVLADSPIIAGDLHVQDFLVAGVRHELVDVGWPEGWDAVHAASDLARIVEQSLPLWGELPYDHYVFLNVFRRGGGGLEHANSTLLTTNADRVTTEPGYRSWLSFVAHEYFHAFNVKRLRPIELGPFDYEAGPVTPSLWLSEGVTSYYASLLLVRSGLTDTAGFLASMSSPIRQLQSSPGRLLQSLEQSSREVWTNSNSGVGAAETTVSYYVKGQVAGFLLDAEIRRATAGARSLDEVMRLAYERYGGEHGFTPEDFRATTEEVAGTELGDWFHATLASTEELDYSPALEWYGLRFADDGSWTLELAEDATPEMRAHLRDLVTP